MASENPSAARVFNMTPSCHQNRSGERSPTGRTTAIPKYRTAHGISKKTRAVQFAVGTTIADRPPHRSVRAELPHTAPTLDVLRQIARQDMDAGYGVEESTVRRSVADGTR